ncbi:MAG: hypothetical protein JW902_15050 [Syntrophaceae bacterium]|nr:hypothetical protein [Syntrophaceae bacterium]
MTQPETGKKTEPININAKVNDLVDGNKDKQTGPVAVVPNTPPIPESKVKDPAFRARVIELAIDKLEKRERVPLGGKELADIATAVDVKNKAMVRRVLREESIHPKVRTERTEAISVKALNDAKLKLAELKKANK